jgi:hypothetical protein
VGKYGLREKIQIFTTSVVDPDPFDTDTDPAFLFDTDLDPDFHFDTDPDPDFQFDTDPDPQHFITRGFGQRRIFYQVCFALIKLTMH